MPQIGAARTYLSDADWQPTVALYREFVAPDDATSAAVS